MKIQKLPTEAISKLESGLIIADVAQCVLELVYNSLDAEATGVAVRIDLKSYQIRVTDNGKGIGREDFELVGEKFMTSKYHSFHNLDSAFPKYGFKGQALSSLRNVCKSLIIETKSEDDGPTLIKVFQNNKVSEISEVNSGRNGAGTTVTVEDFMCTMPVRRKRINEVLDIEEIKSQLQHLAVIHYNVCFTLRNDNKGIILLQTPQASNMLESISNIFGETVARSLKALHYKEKEFEITGFINIKPQIQNNIQLLYVNQRIITKGVTHKFINNVIKEYVGKNTLYGDSARDQVFKNLKNCCHNVFIIKITCPHSHYELFINLRKTKVEFRNWKDVMKSIHKAIKKGFKDSLNLDTSNVPGNDDISDNRKVKHGGIFGTSILLNAVKGAPVKRAFTTKKDNRRKKKRLSEIQDKTYTPEADSYREPMNEQLNDLSQVKEISHDSLESPIPRKLFKNTKPNIEVRHTAIFNLLLFEFYEWMKAKLERDENAFFNGYNDFLKFKNEVNHFTPHGEDMAFKSPILGGKLKKKKMITPKKLKQKQEKKENRYNYFSFVEEEMSVMGHKQLKIFPRSHLRMEKAVQFTEQKRSDFLKNLNFNVKTKSSSSNSSEIQLTNIIKFRNWSETSGQQQSPDVHNTSENSYNLASGTWFHSQDFISKNVQLHEQRGSITETFFGHVDRHEHKPLEDNSGSASDMWASHYEDFAPRNAKFHGQNRSATGFPFYGDHTFHADEKSGGSNFKNAQVNISSDVNSTTKDAKGFQDVDIQVNLSKIVLEKPNVMVQTSPKEFLIREFPGINNGDEIDLRILNDIKSAEIAQPGTRDLSREVPGPNFWNTSAKDCNGYQLCPDFNEVITKMPTPAFTNEKSSSSSEFLCGQKSNSVTKLQNEGSISKDTQTLAAISSDSLKEIINTHTAAYSNSKSESTILKTIPLEEIEWDIVQPIESEFCLTKRHDFIPKGLSPPFFHSEISKAFTLNSSEKSKLKVTVDNARSNLLATVKWQDEFTGNSLKPTIPDELLGEMLQKAEKNLTTFGNPILSASVSYCAVKVHNLLHSFAFTKELLSSVEVLGQLDKKFIVTKMKLSIPKKMDLISLFDQHAVDERIKLEELIKDYSSPDGKFLATRLDSAVECILNESDVRILCDLNEKLLNFGFNFKKVNDSTVSINEIPTFVLNKHEKDLKNKKEISLPEVLKSLILNIIDEMKETRGALPKIPRLMHNAFCLEACHKAIKFNRALSAEKMIEMINKLKNCKLPFQCAHGRPSVIPIIDLEHFQPSMEFNETIELEKIKKFRTSLGNIHQ